MHAGERFPTQRQEQGTDRGTPGRRKEMTREKSAAIGVWAESYQTKGTVRCTRFPGIANRAAQLTVCSGICFADRCGRTSASPVAILPSYF